MVKKYYSSELYHYGVKGQVHGTRNFQNEDGSYKPEAQAENQGHGRYYNYDSDGGKDFYSPGNKSNKVSQSNKKQYAKSVNRDNNSSIFTEDDKRLMKKVAIGAAVALGVGAAGYLYIRYKTKPPIPINNDIILDSNDILQRIAPADEKELHDVFYAAFDQHDKARYANMMGKHYKDRGVEEIVNKAISVNGEIKIAGHDTAEKVFNDVFKYNRKYKNNMQLIRNYDEFNRYTVAANRGSFDDLQDSFYNDFFNALKEKGYQGFIDINDQKYSGYNAKAPIILFNDTSKFSIKSESEIPYSEVGRKYMKELGTIIKENIAKMTPSEFAKENALSLAGLGGYVGYLAYNLESNKNNKDDKSKNVKKT